MKPGKHKGTNRHAKIAYIQKLYLSVDKYLALS